MHQGDEPRPAHRDAGIGESAVLAVLALERQEVVEFVDEESGDEAVIGIAESHSPDSSA